MKPAMPPERNIIELSKQHGVLIFVGILALCMQFQITWMRVEGVYSGLRLAASDLLLPITGLCILYSLGKRMSSWPEWGVRSLPVFCGLLFLVLCLAYAHTVIAYGIHDLWGLHNKVAGWPVMVMYLFLAGWLRANFDDKITYNFLLIFFVLFVLQAFYGLWPYLMRDTGMGHNIKLRAIDGFIDNRNTFGMLMILSAVFFHLFSADIHHKALKGLVYAYWFLMPVTLMHVGSRTALLAAIGLFIAALIHGFYTRTNRTSLLLFIMGALFTMGLYAHQQKNIQMIKNNQVKSITLIERLDKINEIQPKLDGTSEITYIGDNVRLLVLRTVIPMIRENPLFGSGLGSIRIVQEQGQSLVVDIMDNTALWLVAETGIAGFLVFACFYAAILIYMVRQWRKSSGFEKKLYGFVLISLLVFSFTSIFHEILYTRHLWMIWGLGLAIPLTRRQGVYTARAEGAFQKNQSLFAQTTT